MDLARNKLQFKYVLDTIYQSNFWQRKKLSKDLSCQKGLYFRTILRNECYTIDSGYFLNKKVGRKGSEERGSVGYLKAILVLGCSVDRV